MPYRTTPAAVRKICEVDDDFDDAALDPYLEAANSLVTDIVLPAYDPPATPAKLELVERWLSAHFYSVRDPVSISEWISSLRTFYEYKVDLHLNLTRYGQQAILLDTSGSLAAFNNRLKKADKILPAEKRDVTAFWLGSGKDRPAGTV